MADLDTTPACLIHAWGPHTIARRGPEGLPEMGERVFQGLGN